MPRIELGTSVVPTYPRHPMMLAQQALTVNAASGGRLCLGIGLSHQIVIESMLGMSFDKPVRHLREYLTVLARCARRARRLRRRGLPASTPAISVPGTAPFPIVVAALGPQMLKVTAELADGTLTWCTGPQTLAEPHRADDQRRGRGRRAPGASGDRRPPGVRHRRRRRARRERAAKVFAVYGQLPSYRAMLDREGAAGADDIAIIGTAGEVIDRIGALADIGVTDFAAVEFGGDPDEVAATRAALVESLAG